MIKSSIFDEPDPLQNTVLYSVWGWRARQQDVQTKNACGSQNVSLSLCLEGTWPESDVSVKADRPVERLAALMDSVVVLSNYSICPFYSLARETIECRYGICFM